MTTDHGGERAGSDRSPPPSYCERARRLLSLSVDEEATPAQEQELARHLPDCAACRKAREVDRAVRSHLQRVADSLPAARIAERVVREALRVRREIVAANRLLIGAAAAAVLVAAVVWTTDMRISVGPGPDGDQVTAGRGDRGRLQNSRIRSTRLALTAGMLTSTPQKSTSEEGR